MSSPISFSKLDECIEYLSYCAVCDNKNRKVYVDDQDHGSGLYIKNNKIVLENPSSWCIKLHSSCGLCSSRAATSSFYVDIKDQTIQAEDDSILNRIMIERNFFCLSKQIVLQYNYNLEKSFYYINFLNNKTAIILGKDFIPTHENILRIKRKLLFM